MKPKNIFIAVLLALVIIVLFNNKEESVFWFFGEIKTSKLLILGVFFFLGVITGGFLFRRKNKHPKEYAVSNPNTQVGSSESLTEGTSQESLSADDSLSEEDKEFLRRD